MGRREQRRVKQSLQQTAQRTVCLDVEVVEPGPQLWVVGNYTCPVWGSAFTFTEVYLLN